MSGDQPQMAGRGEGYRSPQRLWPSTRCVLHNCRVALLSGSSFAGIKGQRALHTRGLTSSFPVTENMRARPSGVHTVGTEASYQPDPSLHHFPYPPFYSLSFHPGYFDPRTLPIPSKTLNTHPGVAGPQERRYRSRGRGGSTPRSLRVKKKYVSFSSWGLLGLSD